MIYMKPLTLFWLYKLRMNKIRFEKYNTTFSNIIHTDSHIIFTINYLFINFSSQSSVSSLLSIIFTLGRGFYLQGIFELGKRDERTTRFWWHCRCAASTLFSSPGGLLTEPLDFYSNIRSSISRWRKGSEKVRISLGIRVILIF